MTALRDNITCIWYPSGGFGHFVNAVLVLHSTKFTGPSVPLQFGVAGDSHSFPLTLPKYWHNPTDYALPALDPASAYTVLIDNGINDESTEYRGFFTGSTTLKICYSDWSWPIVAKTMITKAMQRDFALEISADLQHWPGTDSWALREKYFLYLKDHALRHCWKADRDCYNLMIDDMLNYRTMLVGLSEFGVADTFMSDWEQWRRSNDVYIAPIMIAQQLIKDLQNPTRHDLPVCDIWTQAVINYYIWLQYGVEVPANEYSDWFTNCPQIATLLQQHGVHI